MRPFFKKLESTSIILWEDNPWDDQMNCFSFYHNSFTIKKLPPPTSAHAFRKFYSYFLKYKQSRLKAS